VLFIFAFFFLEESPHWLVVNWQIREASDVVAKMVQWKLLAGVSIEEGEKLNTLVYEELPGQLRPPRLQSFEAFEPSLLGQINVGIEEGEEDTTPQDSGRNDPSRDDDNASEHSNCSMESRASQKEPLWKSSLRGDGLQLEVDRFMTLFSPSFFRTTLIMLYICFASNFAYYGMIYGLPDTLKKAALEEERQGADSYDSKGRGWSPAAGIFMGAMSEIPGVCVAIVLGITVGRRKNMCFAFTMCGLSLIAVVHCISTRQLVQNLGMVSVLSVKLFLATGYIVVYLYLLECYPTTCRATGLAFCMVCGRFGAFIVPFLYDGAHLLGVDHLYFFVIMATIVFGAAVATCLLPFETKDAELVADTADSPVASKAWDANSRMNSTATTPETTSMPMDSQSDDKNVPRRLSCSPAETKGK
jgi:hypothetical protein